MRSFKITWPEQNLSITCHELKINGEVFDKFYSNLPTRSLQGHEVTGGWVLRNRSMHFHKVPFLLEDAYETITLKSAPVGTVCLTFPQGSSGELVIRYDDCVDTRQYIPIAEVLDEDLEILKKIGKEAWTSVIRTKKVMFAEFEQKE